MNISDSKQTKNARIIVIANQKGGVGKTTTAHAMATGLEHKGYKTLTVDIDPQSNLSYTMNADPDRASVYELMKGLTATAETIQSTDQGDILPGSLMLSGADMEFTDTGREYILAELLEPLRSLYDYIIIDSPPTLGILTINALTAAQDLVIPLGADAYSLHGLSQLYATIKKVKKHCNPKLRIAGLLITRHSGRTVLARDLKDIIKEKAQFIGAQTFNTVIRESVAIKETQVRQTSLYSNGMKNAKSNPAIDYMSFIDEYLSF
jgi:chromosome partitioning protein